MAEAKQKRKKVLTPPFRAAFVNVFSYERQMEGATGKPKYSVTAIFDPSTFSPEDKVRWKQLREIADEASISKFKKPVDKLPSNFKKPFRDGAEKEHLNGFGEGKVFVKLSSLQKPGIVASDGKTPITDAEAFYAGCWARASVTAYAYDNVGKGVAIGLQNLMFVKDDERLDGRTDAEEDFGEFGSDDDNADDLL